MWGYDQRNPQVSDENSVYSTGITGQSSAVARELVPRYATSPNHIRQCHGRFGVLGQTATVVHHCMRPCCAELTLCVGRCPNMMLAKGTPVAPRQNR